MKICQVCKTEYAKKPKSTYIEYEASKYCSAKCRSISVAVLMRGNKFGKGWPKGKSHSEATKFKVSTSKLLNPSRPWLGKKRSSETVAKTSAYAKTRTGKHAPNWKEDRSTLAKSDRQAGHAYRVWRESVFDRDKHECQFKDDTCAGRLEAHHIFVWHQYSHLRYEVNNGITLCHQHHPRKWEDEHMFAASFIVVNTLTITG